MSILYQSPGNVSESTHPIVLAPKKKIMPRSQDQSPMPESPCNHENMPACLSVPANSLVIPQRCHNWWSSLTRSTSDPCQSHWSSWTQSGPAIADLKTRREAPFNLRYNAQGQSLQSTFDDSVTTLINDHLNCINMYHITIALLAFSLAVSYSVACLASLITRIWHTAMPQLYSRCSILFLSTGNSTNLSYILSLGECSLWDVHDSL